jgi:hypothetical protein
MRRYAWMMITIGLAAACASTGGAGEGTETAREQAADTARPTPVAVLVEVPDPPPVALAPGVTPENLATRVEQFAPVEIDFDDTLLDAEQRIVIRKLVEASDIMGEIFLEQVWRTNPAYREGLRSGAGPGVAVWEYYAIMAGPWDRLRDNEPFLDVGPKPPGAGYYPETLTGERIEAYIAEHPEFRDAITSYHTIIQIGGNGQLVPIPYSNAYRDRLERAAALLDEAAAHAENASLEDFLTKRAEAFRTNDYYASEIAWMNLEGNLIDPTIGPYEVYEDELMGWKAAFESFIAIRDPGASADLEVLVSHLPDLEAALPIEDEYKNLDRSFASPLSVADVIYTAGDARRGIQTLAYNLPNDPRVTEKHGTKKVMLRNVIDAKFEKVLVPIAERVMDPALVAEIGPKPFFTYIVMHELAHGLGPNEVHGSETPVSVALQTAYSAIEEAKADVIGVHSLARLTDQGIYPSEFKRQVYISAVASLFRCVRFGTGEAHAKGCAVQFNALLDMGAILVGADGRFTIDFDKIGVAYADLGRTLLMLEATGQRERAEQLLAEKGTLPPAVQAALDRLTDIPVDVWPRYTVVEKMAAW